MSLALPADPIVRSKTATFRATIVDEQQSTSELAIDWYQGKTCDSALAAPPAVPSTIGRPEFAFVPTELGTGCVAVVVTDKHGARAADSKIYQVVDQPPTAVIDVQPMPGQTVPSPGDPIPLPLFAQVTLSGAHSFDPDDVTLTCIWNIYFSDGSAVPLPTCPDRTKGDCICTFATTEPGHYHVELVVQDASEKTSSAEQIINVDHDQAPKIVIDSAQPPPQTSADDSPIFLFANVDNTFTIHRVEDDGDPYPVSGTTATSTVAGFIWYVREGGASFFRRLMASGPSLTLFADTFPAGQTAQVRAEYRDRVTACQPKTDGCDAAFSGCNRDAPVCYAPDYVPERRAQWITWTVSFQ